MKSIFKSYLYIWMILVIVFNIVVFVTPSEIGGASKFRGSFWVGYIFIMLTFCGQLAIAWLGIGEVNSSRMFYNIPMINISYITLIVMIVIGTVCMVFPQLPIWIGIIVCVCCVAFGTIALLAAKATADIVCDIDKKIKDTTFFIKNLTYDLDTLRKSTGSEVIKNEVDKVYQVVKYSDPVSNDALHDIEYKLNMKYKDLYESVKNENIEKVSQYSRDFIILMDERNNKCKLLK